MSYEFRLPDIGEGVVEGEVVKWKVSEGETILMDQPMVDVMTDKATVEIPAPRAGKVARLMVAEGGICKVGEVLIVIDDGASQPAKGNGHSTTPIPTPIPTPSTSPSPSPSPTTSTSTSTTTTTIGGGRVLATPSTRKIARDLGVDLRAVTPTGKMGRVTSDDVRRHHGTGGAVAGGTAGGIIAPERPAYAPISIPKTAAEERVPFRGLRKAIAANMARSKATATHFTYVEEIDMTLLVKLRDRTKRKAAERGFKLSYLPFIIKAVVAGLKKWPSLNSSLDESTQEIVLKKYYHIGVATQGPQGLSVGVLRDADQKSIFQLSAEIDRIANAIRDGKATREELTGSTFTISSLGALGGVLATPIINFPEAAILGVHKIEERPAVRAGKIVPRHLMNLSISIDHRIADGYDGAMFMQEVKTYLEDPTLMFMEMV